MKSRKTHTYREPSEREVWAHFRDNELDWDAVKADRASKKLAQKPLNAKEKRIAKRINDNDQAAMIEWMRLPEDDQDRITAFAQEARKAETVAIETRRAKVVAMSVAKAVNSKSGSTPKGQPPLTIDDIRAGRNMHLFRTLPKKTKETLWAEAFPQGHPGAGDVALDAASEGGTKHDFLNVQHQDGVHNGLMGLGNPKERSPQPHQRRRRK